MFKEKIKIYYLIFERPPSLFSIKKSIPQKECCKPNTTTSILILFGSMYYPYTYLVIHFTIPTPFPSIFIPIKATDCKNSDTTYCQPTNTNWLLYIFC